MTTALASMPDRPSLARFARPRMQAAARQMQEILGKLDRTFERASQLAKAPATTPATTAGGAMRRPREGLGGTADGTGAAAGASTGDGPALSPKAAVAEAAASLANRVGPQAAPHRQPAGHACLPACGLGLCKFGRGGTCPISAWAVQVLAIAQGLLPAICFYCAMPWHVRAEPGQPGWR